MNTHQSKKLYISPKIEAIQIELEQGIAAGSQGQVSNTPEESWDKVDDDNRTINW